MGTLGYPMGGFRVGWTSRREATPVFPLDREDRNPGRLSNGRPAEESADRARQAPDQQSEAEDCKRGSSSTEVDVPNIRDHANYAKIMKIPWEPIPVKYNPKEQWIPTKDEINAMVNGASKRFAPILQTLLTTGARIGELCKLKWTDINSENCTISINDGEKGSKNRTLKVPSKTILMINGLPKTNDVYVFDTKPSNARVRLQDLRKKLARTQNNPRFLRIHLHRSEHTLEHKRQDTPERRIKLGMLWGTRT